MACARLGMAFKRRDTPGLIQSLSQGLLPGLSAWVEVGGIGSSLCSRAVSAATLPLSGRQGAQSGVAGRLWRPVHSRGFLDLK